MRTLTLGFLAAVLVTVAEAAPEGPPYFDPERSLDKQKVAGRAAVAVAKSGTAKEVVPFFADVSVRVRDEVLKALIKRNDSEFLASLEKALGIKDEFVAATVAELYGRCKYAAGREALEKVGLKAKSEMATLEAIWALEAIGSAKSGKALEKTHKKKHGASEYRVQGDALIAFAVVDADRARPFIVKALKHKKAPFRIAGLVALGRISVEEAAAAAVVTVTAKQAPKSQRAWEARELYAALEAFSNWLNRAGDPALFAQAVDGLIGRLAREEALAKHRVGVALFDLTGEAIGDDAQGWASWWEARKASFEPKDKVVVKETKKRKTKKKDGDEDVVGEDKKKKGPETGGGTRVRFHGIPIYSNRMIFAQDVSGGMTMEKVDNADASSPTRMKFSTDELKRVLGKLGDDVMTNIVFFATRYKSTAERLFPIKRARDKLIEYVDQEAVTPRGKAMSRSNLYDTLAFALNDPEIDTVYFLSEGGPSSGRFLHTARFMRHLARLNVYRRVQVHSLQVSSTSWGEKFLRALSKTTEGQFYGLEFLRRNHGS